MNPLLKRKLIIIIFKKKINEDDNNNNGQNDGPSLQQVKWNTSMHILLVNQT